MQAHLSQSRCTKVSPSRNRYRNDPPHAFGAAAQPVTQLWFCAGAGYGSMIIQPRGMKRNQPGDQYAPRPFPGAYPGMPQMFMVPAQFGNPMMMGGGTGAFSFIPMPMPMPQHQPQQQPQQFFYVDPRVEAWSALTASSSTCLGRWGPVCGVPSAAPLEPALVYQLITDSTFRPGARPTTFSSDTTVTWIFKEGKGYVSSQPPTPTASLQ